MAIVILGFAGAIPLILLGGFLLFLRPHRSPQVFFGLFALTYGLQHALLWGGEMTGDPVAYRLLTLLGLAAIPVATLFLVHFAMIVRRRRYHWVATAIAGVISATAAIVLIMRQELIFVSVDPFAYGPLNYVLLTYPQRIAFFLALFVMYLEYRQAKAGTPRRRIRGMLIAFALIVSYITFAYLLNALAAFARSGNTIEFASHAVTRADYINEIGMLAIFTVMGLTLIGFVVHMILRPPPPEGIDSPLVFAFVFPAFVAGLELGLGAIGIPFETGGFWAILAVAVIVYTLASYQLFGLELKVKKYAGPIAAAFLVLFGIPTLLTLALGEYGLQAFSFAVIPQVVGIAGAVVFQDRIKQALFPGVDDTPDYVHQRKMDIYRVALEEALQRTGKTDDPRLKELRLRHGITETEHSIISWMVASEQHKTAPASNQKFKTGQTVLERYRLERVIGKGSYGETFLAHDIQARRPVALKTVEIDTYEGAAAKLLLREARLAATLDHPYVIDILDVAELPERAVMVMEYAENGNLEDHLGRHGALELPDAVRFTRELLMALEAVHEKQIVHANLKPKNLLVEADNSIRLADFGAAQAEKSEHPQKSQIAQSTLKNILYQSPEQLRGEPATPQSDLFVTAILFHELLTRRHPFPIAGKDDHRIRTTLIKGKPRLLVSDEPEWVSRLLMKALAHDPKDRYADAAAMRQELEECAGVAGRAPAATAQPAPESGSDPPPAVP